MGRPKKNNADWFPHSRELLNTPRIKMMINEFGLLGYGFYCAILEILCENESIKIKKDDDLIPLLASNLSLSEEDTEKMLNYSIKRKLLQETKEEIYSEELIADLKPLFDKREKMRKARLRLEAKKRAAAKKAEQLSLPEGSYPYMGEEPPIPEYDEYIEQGLYPETDINLCPEICAAQTPQSRVEQSTGEKSKNFNNNINPPYIPPSKPGDFSEQVNGVMEGKAEFNFSDSDQNQSQKQIAARVKTGKTILKFDDSNLPLFYKVLLAQIPELLKELKVTQKDFQKRWLENKEMRRDNLDNIFEYLHCIRWDKMNNLAAMDKPEKAFKYMMENKDGWKFPQPKKFKDYFEQQRELIFENALKLKGLEAGKVKDFEQLNLDDKLAEIEKSLDQDENFLGLLPEQRSSVRNQARSMISVKTIDLKLFKDQLDKIIESYSNQNLDQRMQ